MIKKTLKSTAILTVWVLIWQVIAIIINDNFLIPTPLETLKALFALCRTGQFYLAVFKSIFRIIIGFILGVTVGFLGGIAANKFSLFNDITKPAMQVIRAVPVASFIILAFYSFESNEMPIFIAFLMVLPMIWSTTQTALSGIDDKFLELGKVYKLSFWKIFFKIKLPFIMPTLLTSCLTALGFAWKSGIAAEVICRPQIALGTLLNDNKNYFDMPAVFAITVVVALLSIVLEIILKKAVRRVLNAKN